MTAVGHVGVNGLAAVSLAVSEDSVNARGHVPTQHLLHMERHVLEITSRRLPVMISLALSKVDGQAGAHGRHALPHVVMMVYL